MPIVSADLQFRYSTTAGAAGNTVVGTPVGSLGKYISQTQIPNGTLSNLFDTISADENAASDVEYRCLFVYNSHASLTFQNVKVWIFSEVTGGATAAISVDTTGVTNLGAGPAVQAKQIANENTAPAGQVFSAPVTKGTGLTLPNIGPGQVCAIWVGRTAHNTAAQALDGVTLRVEGDTPA